MKSLTNTIQENLEYLNTKSLSEIEKFLYTKLEQYTEITKFTVRTVLFNHKIEEMIVSTANGDYADLQIVLTPLSVVIRKQRGCTKFYDLFTTPLADIITQI